VPTAIPPTWRAIYDEAGRMIVAINFNMDIGDAWEHADMPDYPEAMTSLAYRFGINYILYAMTHERPSAATASQHKHRQRPHHNQNRQ
jgi:hypothetical protein